MKQNAEDRAIEKIINEELGINEDVRVLSYNLTKEVINNYDGSGTYVTSCIVFNKFYYFKFTFKDYTKFSAVPDLNNAQYSGVTYFDYKTVIIEGYTIRGKIIEKRLRETLQHEIHHIFEICMSKRDGFLKDAASEDTYKTATEEVKNKQNSETRRGIGYAIYLSHTFESRAFENGTYAFIMSQVLHFMGDELEAAKRSGFYQRILLIKEAYKFINNNIEEASVIAEDIYGKSYNWLKKTVSFALKECRRQFGRAVIKAGKDYDWTHGGKTLITI